MARVVTGRRKVLSMYRSYHGNTATAISLTGDPRRWANEPADGSVAHFFGPYPYRSSFHATRPEEEAAARARAPRADHHRSRARRRSPRSSSRRSSAPTACSCRRPATSPGVRALCDRYGIVYIADEVMVGFGRVGEWFAVNALRRRARPHHLREGRELGLRAARRRRDLQTGSPRTSTPSPFPGGLTYSGHPLACAAGVATFEVFERDGILERVRDLGARVVEPRLRDMATRHPSRRRGARARPVLGDRAGARPRDARAARAVQRERSGCRTRWPRSPPPASRRASGRSCTSTACTSRRRS